MGSCTMVLNHKFKWKLFSKCTPKTQADGDGNNIFFSVSKHPKFPDDKTDLLASFSTTFVKKISKKDSFPQKLPCV